MLPLCADEGVATMVWSPLARGRLARGRLARPAGQANATERAATDGAYADTLYTKANADKDRQILDEVGAVADARGVTRAQVALAWLRRNPVVAAPIVGARTIQQIDDAVVSLDLDITDKEARRLEAPYSPATTSRASPTNAYSSASRPASPATPTSDAAPVGHDAR
jgi:1-deoxyxylulose-5-phosphate synthase